MHAHDFNRNPKLRDRLSVRLRNPHQEFLPQQLQEMRRDDRNKAIEIEADESRSGAVREITTESVNAYSTSIFVDAISGEDIRSAEFLIGDYV